ncbi:MAG: phage holin family protein [Candidatus Sumerlaeia bacterium]|nr:phage holin family protein [Candidatus Sumerlaeia bacterium]
MNWELIAIQLGINTVVLWALAFLCGGRIRIRGLVPVLSVSIVLGPINVFIGYIDYWLGIPLRPHYMFLSAVVLNGVMLYLLSYIIPKVTVENFRIALAFSAIMGLMSLVLYFVLAPRLAALL